LAVCGPLTALLCAAAALNFERRAGGAVCIGVRAPARLRVTVKNSEKISFYQLVVLKLSFSATAGGNINICHAPFS
jgi:hypothetical protein